MEARIVKLVECIENNKSQELSQIAAFQLGQIAKETTEAIIEKILKLFFNQNIEVRFSGGLALSEILTNSAVQCKLPELPLKFCDFMNSRENSYKKAKTTPEAFTNLLNAFRALILHGSWEEKHGAFIGLKVILNLKKVCKECEEDILCRCILSVSDDNTADYSGDLAEFPLRTLGAEVISLASVSFYSSIEVCLLDLLKQNTLAVLICFRKAKVHSLKAYESVQSVLKEHQNEDVIAEAFHYLAKYPLAQDQQLVDLIVKLINASDYLSSYIKYAIKVLNILFNLNCTLPPNFTKIYELFTHNLTEVRISTISAFISLVHKSCIDIEIVFSLATQSLLLETNAIVIKQTWVLIKILMEKYDINELIDKKVYAWNEFLMSKEPKNYSFFYLPERTSGEEVYSFADNNTDEDIKSQAYLEKKHIERIWKIGKLISKAKRTIEYKDNIDKFLWVLCYHNKDLNSLYQIIYTETEGKIENIRIKSMAVYKVVLLSIENHLDMPEKITPIIQAIVTSYRHETHPLLKKKIAKTAARLTFLLKSRNCNEKFIKNLIKIHSYPIIYYLQQIHTDQTPLLFDYYKDLTNTENLKIVTEYIHPSLESYFKHHIDKILSLLPNASIASSLGLILTQVPGCLLNFVEYLIKYLSVHPLPHTDPLKVLKDLLKNQIVSFIPYSSCILLPLLSHLNSECTSEVAEVFSEILCVVMLDSSDLCLSESLAREKASCMEFLGNLKGVYTLPKYVPRVLIRGIELRDYQKDGIAWMRFLASFRLGGMLCDEMGLGKTIQSLCVIAEAHLDHPDAVSLIVCPSTIVGHWVKEAKNYLDLNICNLNEGILKGLLVISYKYLISNIETIAAHQFLYTILDEGHLLSNPNTKAFKSVKLIKSNYRIILTGTPIQNKILEIWPFFDFLMPGFLGTHSEFSCAYQKYLKPKKSEKTIKFKDEYLALQKLNTLHKKILPFVLRRLKKDILKDLPEKIIQDYYVELNLLQKNMLYKFYEENKSSQLEEINFLRKLCNHPKLVDPSITDNKSPKLEAIKELMWNCEICEETGASHKALVFTQMKKMLDIIETDVMQAEFPLTKYSRLDGSVPHCKRFEICEEFNNNHQNRVLLMTTDAGGLGLNLQAADVVIFVDHSWNPVKDLQAMDRTHRIGQKNIVNVYRLITRDTLEEQILGLQSFKTRISETLVDVENSSMKSVDPTALLSNIIENQ